jgi:hypothetical protein
MIEPRQVNVIFVKEYRYYIHAFDKKSKEDYVLNVSKIIKEKFNTKFIIPNPVQSFLLNYEIKKLLDKAINIKNQKYSNIVYLNSNLTYSSIINTVSFMEAEYSDIEFKFKYVEHKDFDDMIHTIDFLEILQLK